MLDVTDFMFNHPGGKFTIENNIGRDISKFFYGGYAQDNIDIGPRGPKFVAHSNMARAQVQSMIVARHVHTANKFTSKVEMVP